LIRTPLTELLGIEHPVVSAGMGAGAADGELAGTVSAAGGLGVIGGSFVPPDELRAMVRRARELTANPIGINLLLHATEDRIDDVLHERPAVFSTAWPRDDQDLHAIFARAHDAGAKVMHAVQTAADAERAVEAGADVVVAQGAEAGGHVGLIGTSVIVRQVVLAIAPVPVVAAGGFADGAGLAAALALGAAGALLGTRFLATEEAPLAPWEKEAIVASDGSDTIVTTVNDTLTGRDWPGARVRMKRTRFVEEWLGREPELRRRRAEVWEKLARADEAEDAEKKLGRSLDEVFPKEDYQIMHTLLFPRDVVHIENLGGDIDQVLDQKVTFGCFPWRFQGGEAAFCRAVAFLDWS
jgi:NAD(P)H-dependent flavin oxidoreductase YrpB (nitropropane dioxygenase family)